jgi:methyl-accepting chemotaxis protein
MKKLLLFLPLVTVALQGCSTINETLDALQRNREAIDRSTQVIDENREAIEAANRGIDENRRQLEEINKTLKKAGES